jgi:recombination protein RecA
MASKDSSNGGANGSNNNAGGNHSPGGARDKAIDLALGAIEKQFGKGSIMRLTKDAIEKEVAVVPTGSLGLDIALGIGGLPRGRIIEIYGPESSGKTTMTLHIVAEAQKRGGVCAFIDAEHALDVGYAKKLGVKTEELLVSQPDFGEQALEIADMLVRSNAVDVVVIDSVAALTPKAEIEGEMGDSHMGLQARLMSQALRKLTGAISKSRTMVIFINQIRMKIGVMFGSPETTTGGNALKFYASVRLDIRRVGALKKDEDVIGNRTRVKVVKNKMAPPFREVEFDIIYGTGISKEGDLVDLASDANIVDKSGAWFSYGGERIGQGRENAKQFLSEHPDMYASIEAKVLAHHNIRRVGIEVVNDAVPSAVPAAGSAPSMSVDDKSVKSKAAAIAPAVPASAPAATVASPATSTAKATVVAPATANGKRPSA